MMEPLSDAELIQQAYESAILNLLNVFFLDFVTDALGAGKRLQRGMALARQARNEAANLIET